MDSLRGKSLPVVCIALLLSLVNGAGDKPNCEGIRLFNNLGQPGAEGRVEIWCNGQWGTIRSNDRAIDLVICRQLGFDKNLRPIRTTEFGEGYGIVWDVQCSGHEATIQECNITQPPVQEYSYQGIATEHFLFWDHDKDIGVKCEVSVLYSESALSTILKTEKTITTSTSTENGNTGETGIQPGIVVGFLSVMVLAICIIAIIVWKFKIKKNASMGKGAHSNVERSIGMYEDINHRKDAVNDDSYETPNKRNSSSNADPDVNNSHVQQHSVYSEEIIRQTSERQANTPDGTYEKPDVSVYSYADPNELRFNKA